MTHSNPRKGRLVNTSDSLQPFRLALSYLEKVEEELAKWKKVRATRNSDVTTFDEVRSAYIVHRRNAQKVVDGYRANAKRDIAPLEEELRLQKRAHRKFLEQASAGALDPKAANATNREISERVAALEDRLGTASAIASADTSEDVGGFIVLPLDEYRKKLVPPETPEVKREFEMPSLTGSVAVLVAVIAIAIGAYVYFTTGGSAEATFDAQIIGEDLDKIRVTCRNVGKRPLDWYVPWPEGSSKNAGSGSSVFGLLLYVLEADGDSAKLVPNSEGCWKYRGLDIVDAEPIEVRPRLAVSVVLDIVKLREIGVEARVIRIVYTRKGSGEVGRFETVLE